MGRSKRQIKAINYRRKNKNNVYNVQGSLIFLVAIISIILFSSFSTALTFPQNSIADIKHSIRVDGGITSGILCNITVYYSNNSLLVNYQEMTDMGDYFNYTLNENQTKTKGIYNYDISCFHSSANVTDSFSYNVNYGGVEPSQERTDTTKFGITFFIILGILLFAGSFFSKKFPIKLTLILFGVLSFLIVIDLTFVALQDEIINPKMEGFFSSFVAISFYLFWFIGFLIATLWIVTIIQTSIGAAAGRKERRFE